MSQADGSEPLAGFALDLRCAAGQISGLQRFGLSIADSLAARSQPTGLSVILAPGQARVAGHALARIDLPPAGHLSIRQQGRNALALHTAGIHTVVSPDVFAPLPLPGLRRQRQVVTLHDLAPLRIPEYLQRGRKARFRHVWRAWLTLQLRSAWRVLTVSDHAAADIAAMFPFAARKLRVVPNTVRLPADVDRVAVRSAEPPGRFRLLFVGRADGHKNLETCVDVLARLTAAGVDAELLLIGPSDPRYPEAAARVIRYGLGSRVTRAGYVDDAALAEAYRGANLFIFLSRYEGFGLPPLEAMSCGVPVLASNQAALPEILGDAALMVDPDDVDAAVAAALRIRDEPGLARELGQRGLARAAAYGPARQAEALLAALAAC